LNASHWVRQIHRWVSIAFVVAVLIVSIVVAAGREPAEWVYLLPLPPLALLGLTGLYLFVLPYFARRRGGGRAAERSH
jgi:membrane protein CcdC involved in cytochrome C biogenesis